MELRRRILGALELAETATDDRERQEWLTIVVVGAGPTGVEIAGQIRELATRSLQREFDAIDPGSVRVVLVDGGKEPLATFGDKLSAAAARELRHLGVELRMNARVTNVDCARRRRRHEGRHRAHRRPARWCGPPASRHRRSQRSWPTASGASVDRAGRIAVLPDLTLPGHPEVFAVGDMVTYDDLPGVAEVAMQGGLHAANTIKRRLHGDTRSLPYRYRDLGSVATIGRFRAVCSFRGLRLSGLPAWIVWLFVHLAFLNGFGNRFTTLRRWMTSMIGRARPERVFSVAHTGGDLSTPDAVRAIVQPDRVPSSTRARRLTPDARTARGRSGAVGTRTDGVHAAFHIILVPLGVSWAFMALIANYRGIKHGDQDALQLAQRWSKYMAVTFAVGAVTGTVLTFEFGLLWPRFMGQWGEAFGIPFAFEGIFFFTEAIFVSIYIYGWRRLKPWAHFWTGVPVVLTGILGSVSVVAANAWMNAPSGFTRNSAGKVVDVDPIGVIFNDAMPLMAAHMVVAAYVVGGFLVASVYAVAMLRGRRDRYHRLGFVIAFSVGAVAIPIQMARRRLTGTMGLQQPAREVRRHRTRSGDCRATSPRRCSASSTPTARSPAGSAFPGSPRGCPTRAPGATP